MKAIRLNHVHVLVRDLDVAITFYETVFGLTHAYSDEEDGETLAFLHVGQTDDVFTLHQRAEFEPGDRLQHYGFRVEGTVEDAMAAVQAAGGTVIGRAGWNPGEVVYVKDPDGNTVEIHAS